MSNNPYDRLRECLVTDVGLSVQRSRDVVRYLIDIGMIDYDILKEAMEVEYINVD